MRSFYFSNEGSHLLNRSFSPSSWIVLSKYLIFGIFTCYKSHRKILNSNLEFIERKMHKKIQSEMLC